MVNTVKYLRLGKTKIHLYFAPGTVDIVNDVELSTTVPIVFTADKKENHFSN